MMRHDQDLEDDEEFEKAKENALQDEPVLAWWVPYTIKKQIAIISKVKSKYWQKTHKYGVRVLKKVRKARGIDDKNGNTLWQDTISMEMKNNRIAFEDFDGKIQDLKGYEQISGHLIFDVKLSENFRRKQGLWPMGTDVNGMNREWIPFTIRIIDSILYRQSDD